MSCLRNLCFPQDYLFSSGSFIDVPFTLGSVVWCEGGISTPDVGWGSILHGGDFL